MRVADDPGRTPDRWAAAFAAGFIVLLLATELVLSLPDETATASSVAVFYAQHQVLIVILQLLGLPLRPYLVPMPGVSGRLTGLSRGPVW